MESDDALCLLLKTLCSLNHLEVEVCNNYDDFFPKYEAFLPDVVLIDYGSRENKEGVEISKRLKKDKYKAPRVIFSSCVHDKKEILSTGADFYLPKPYEADVVIKKIMKFLY